ncbi:MAG: tetratricopeptide repeat protein [Verrucomicrobiaceae bacterium]|nr:tetratricopeptide repeat protein [Verrucomicrobiaceae bacterium]
MKQTKSHGPSAPIIATSAVVLTSLAFGIVLIAYVRMPWPKTTGASPFYARVHAAIGLSLATHSTLEGALAEFRHALKLDPSYIDASNHLANTLFQNGRTEDAIQSYRATLAIDPAHPDANNNLGLALLLSGRVEESIAYFKKSLDHRPNSPDVRSNLGAAFMHLGKLADAERELRAALDAKAGINAHHNLALCLFRQGRLTDSVRAYEGALKLSPDHVNSLSELAWVLSTAADDSIRDGNRALTLAQRAAAITQYTEPRVLRSLAASFAEIGDFSQAQTYANKAHQLANGVGDQSYAEQLAEQIAKYRNQKPWRETNPNP